MRNLCPLPFVSRLGLTLVLLVPLAGEVKADLLVNNINLFDGQSNAPTAWISFTGTNRSFVDVYADPQTATNWTLNGSPIALYCIDTIHENAIGDSYYVNPESPPTFSTATTYSDAANRVAWALENAGSTADSRGATQLLIWSIVDDQFTVNWSATANSGLQTAYNVLVTEMGSNYNAATPYVNEAAFFSADHVGDLYQDLAFATPEPSSMAIAGLGALGMIAYGLRRRPRF